MIKKLNRNTVLIAIAVVAVVATGVLLSNKSAANNIFSFLKPGMSNDAIAKASIDYLNSSVLQAGQTATLKSVSEESGLVKIEIAIGANTYTSYATKDGKLLFPEAFNLTGKNNTVASNDTTGGAAVTPANVAKVEKTSLDAYVVSGCPFGLQMQRAMFNAIKSSPALANYMKVRYIGDVAADGKTITAMHGTEEAAENLRQICIREEQASKYWTYVGCYMQKTAGTAPNGMPYGDTKTCQATAGIDTAKLNACVSDPARGIAYAKEDFALSNKYGVSGSPTLILNEKEVSETGFGGRSADAMRNLVCSSSITEPDFCKTKLDTNPATTSFSLTSTTPTSGATASANNACAPAVQ